MRLALSNAVAANNTHEPVSSAFPRCFSVKCSLVIASAPPLSISTFADERPCSIHAPPFSISFFSYSAQPIASSRKVKSATGEKARLAKILDSQP
jgi:hypothetical protein